MAPYPWAPDVVIGIDFGMTCTGMWDQFRHVQHALTIWKSHRCGMVSSARME